MLNESNYKALELFLSERNGLPSSYDDWKVVSELAEFIAFGKVPNVVKVGTDDMLPAADQTTVQ